MARVYRARHLTLERPCAIKVLKPSIMERDEDAIAAFLAEARAAANLVHPHVVTIHTIGQDRGRHFIEMEYIDGQSLASLAESEGPFAPEQATCFLVQIGSALAVAHDRQLVHRDIKPGNVMVSAERHAKLSDFGLAKRLHEPHGDAGAWLSGTPNFMAPELFQGRPADRRSDVYAMGVTYFLLLTGSLPATAESIPDLMQWHSQRLPPDVRELRPDIPENAAQLVERCLAKNPADRPTDATQLHHELRCVYGSLRSLESLLRESLRGTDVTIEGEGNCFEVIVLLPGSRKQRVVVETCTSLAIAEQVVRIYSICGPADERHYRRALELNPQFAHGAIGLENIQGVPFFVMTNAFPRATCDPDEIRHSVLGIAQRADEVERCISGRDSH
jgi:eukaryotic-like serine/threonine-protein kinase